MSGYIPAIEVMDSFDARIVIWVFYTQYIPNTVSCNAY